MGNPVTSPLSPAERLQALKRRRDKLIEDKARLDEKKRQTKESLATIRKNLATLGIPEEGLEQEIKRREEELAKSVEEAEANLTREEGKVQVVNQRLIQIT